MTNFTGTLWRKNPSAKLPNNKNFEKGKLKGIFSHCLIKNL